MHAAHGAWCLALVERAGDWGRAARLWGAAAAARARSGAPQLPPERAEQEAAMARVRGLLGAEDFAAALAEGEAMTPEQAIRKAMDICPY